MPGIPTLFNVLDDTIERLTMSPDADLQDVGKVMKIQSVYAHLGVIGPTLADFIPGEPPPPGELGGNPYLVIWRQIIGIVGDNMVAEKGLLSLLSRMREIIDRLDEIAEAEDLDALQTLSDEGGLEDIEDVANGLQIIVDQIPGIAVPVAVSIGSAMKPVISVSVGDAVPPHELWKARAQLHWKNTGKFVSALVSRAEAANDDRFRAYAYGYAASYAAKTGASPFANSIVGGPYRTQWWRHRWINNFIAAWTHGYQGAGASVSGDTMTPPYADWPDLCDARLHEKIELPGIDLEDVMGRLWSGDAQSDILPSDFTEFWIAAYQDAHGPVDATSAVREERLNAAYLMTWLVLWFQTSGDVIGCVHRFETLAPPADCGGAPPWVDPTESGSSGGPLPPPTPNPEDFVEVDTAQKVCGFILAIIGGLIFLAGGLVAGGGAIAGGVALILGSVDVDWGKLRCMIYWYRQYLANGLRGLDQLLVYAGFIYPHTQFLGNDEATADLLGTRYDSGPNLVKSRRPEVFPATVWDGTPASWHLAPTTFEAPHTIGYYTTAYPDFFLNNDATNPLTNGRVRDGGSWPVATQAVVGAMALPVQFGNAVANAVDVLQHRHGALPDWNLDGDRGTAYMTWQFKNSLYTDPVDIEPEP